MLGLRQQASDCGFEEGWFVGGDGAGAVGEEGEMGIRDAAAHFCGVVGRQIES
ncbi:MAG: hypothetical protein ACYTGL_11435 [Planctomycetota bacterium]